MPVENSTLDPGVGFSTDPLNPDGIRIFSNGAHVNEE
jgi:hypothetical protein